MNLQQGAYNSTIAAIWIVFSADTQDNLTDYLPMMDSAAWPIGAQKKKELL